MILLIDNYDSFTYNLVHYFAELGAQTDVRRNDSLRADEALALKPKAIVISPGPCDPDKAGITLELIAKAAGQVPVLGVCLGHQAIGQAFGGRVVRAPAPVHGKPSAIHHGQSDVFAGLPSPFEAIRYHSLIVDRDTLPAELRITAETGDGLIMGFAHTILSVYGIQIHPESIATQHGHALLKNFLGLAGIPSRPVPDRQAVA